MKFVKKPLKALLYIPVIMVAAFLGVATTTVESGKYFEISKNIEIFTNLYKEINTFYEDDVDPSRLMRTGIDAMLESLEPYTNYISESEIEGFRMIVRGRLVELVQRLTAKKERFFLSFQNLMKISQHKKQELKQVIFYFLLMEKQQKRRQQMILVIF